MPSPSPDVSSVTVHLDDDSVNAVADRIVQLLRAESIGCELIDVAEVARRFSLSRDYVYEHADDLGAVRLGSGPKARLRFSPTTVRERLSGSPKREELHHKTKPVRTVGSKADGTLLPIRGQ